MHIQGQRKESYDNHSFFKEIKMLFISEGNEKEIYDLGVVQSWSKLACRLGLMT